MNAKLLLLTAFALVACDQKQELGENEGTAGTGGSSAGSGQAGSGQAGSGQAGSGQVSEGGTSAGTVSGSSGQSGASGQAGVAGAGQGGSGQAGASGGAAGGQGGEEVWGQFADPAPFKDAPPGLSLFVQLGSGSHRQMLAFPYAYGASFWARGVSVVGQDAGQVGFYGDGVGMTPCNDDGKAMELAPAPGLLTLDAFHLTTEACQEASQFQSPYIGLLFGISLKEPLLENQRVTVVVLDAENKPTVRVSTGSASSTLGFNVDGTDLAGATRSVAFYIEKDGKTGCTAGDLGWHSPPQTFPQGVSSSLQFLSKYSDATAAAPVTSELCALFDGTREPGKE